MLLDRQLILLLALPLPIASISWTVTHEELLREPREWCAAKSRSCRGPVARKFFYMLTCEFCFSHYVTALFLFITRYQLLFDGWRGYLIAEFSLVWLANVYMSFYGRLRLEIKEERLEIAQAEAATAPQTKGGVSTPRSETQAVINDAGVTSKAGLKTGVPSGATFTPSGRDISAGDRSSIGISAPVGQAGSKLDEGATT